MSVQHVLLTTSGHFVYCGCVALNHTTISLLVRFVLSSTQMELEGNLSFVEYDPSPQV